MKIKRKKVLTRLLMLFICCFVCLYMYFIKTESIVIAWMPTPDITEQVKEYMEAGYCMGGEVSEDGLGATLHLTQWQRQKWLKFLYGDVEQFVEQANGLDYMYIEVSEDTKKVTLHINKQVSFETLATYLGIIVWDIENIQILNDDENWGFDFIVKDMDTEEILYYADFPQNDIKLDASLWDGEIEK